MTIVTLQFTLLLAVLLLLLLFVIYDIIIRGV